MSRAIGGGGGFLPGKKRKTAWGGETHKGKGGGGFHEFYRAQVNGGPKTDQWTTIAIDVKKKPARKPPQQYSEENALPILLKRNASFKSLGPLLGLGGFFNLRTKTGLMPPGDCDFGSYGKFRLWGLGRFSRGALLGDDSDQ